MNGTEYLVIWQRKGTGVKRALYQTLAGAQRCAERQRTARAEMDWLNDPELSRDERPAEIVYGPIIRQREVGPWAEVVSEGVDARAVSKP